MVAIAAGQVTPATIVLDPVVADLAVTAVFPTNDTDVPHVDHTSVVVSGVRIDTPPTYYLALNVDANQLPERPPSFRSVPSGRSWSRA